MTNEQWAGIEKRLLSYFETICLSIDGYKVNISIERSGMKLQYAIYVNGKIKGEWIINDCEIRRRFYQKHTHSLISESEIRKAPSNLRKTLREMKRTFETYSPYWTSFRSLKSHLIKNNDSIELISE